MKLTGLVTEGIRVIARCLGVALVVAALSAPALAHGHHSHGGGGGGGGSVPEIDPGSMGSALTLLSGGALLLGARFRRQSD